MKCMQRINTLGPYIETPSISLNGPLLSFCYQCRTIDFQDLHEVFVTLLKSSNGKTHVYYTILQK